MYLGYRNLIGSLKNHPLSNETVALSDIDGVLDSVDDLTFKKEAVRAFVVLQNIFAELNFLTGRYGNLFANIGIPTLRQNGFDFTKPFSYYAEMGGVKVSLVEGNPPTEKRNLMLKMLDDEKKSYIIFPKTQTRRFWVAELIAPLITEELRELIWQATKQALANLAGARKLIKFSPTFEEKTVDSWAHLIYNRELENITKGTVTTSGGNILPEYSDMTHTINAEFGGEVASEINKALHQYNNSHNNLKLHASHHPEAGCVEVLFEGIDKYQASQKIVGNMIKNISPNQIPHVVTFGDSFNDVKMAQASKALNCYSTHFHFGESSSFREKFYDLEKNERPDCSVVFPTFDLMYMYNPSTTSVTTSGVALWWIIQGVIKQGKHCRWSSLLLHLKNMGAEVLS